MCHQPGTSPEHLRPPTIHGLLPQETRTCSPSWTRDPSPVGLSVSRHRTSGGTRCRFREFVWSGPRSGQAVLVPFPALAVPVRSIRVSGVGHLSLVTESVGARRKTPAVYLGRHRTDPNPNPIPHRPDPDMSHLRNPCPVLLRVEYLSRRSRLYGRPTHKGRPRMEVVTEQSFPVLREFLLLQTWYVTKDTSLGPQRLGPSTRTSGGSGGDVPGPDGSGRRPTRTTSVFTRGTVRRGRSRRTPTFTTPASVSVDPPASTSTTHAGQGRRRVSRGPPPPTPRRHPCHPGSGLRSPVPEIRRVLVGATPTLVPG